MSIIEITESNYRDYLSLDIVAFSFAYEGAMGEMGAIYIISRDGKIYHANYCQGDDPIDTNHINDIIPVFKDISWRMSIVFPIIQIGRPLTCSLVITS